MDQPGTQFRWAKSNDREEWYASLSFSQDGKLLAAITNSVKSYIMVFESIDGNLVTSRSYPGNAAA